jgi:hypothetical protein
MGCIFSPNSSRSITSCLDFISGDQYTHTSTIPTGGDIACTPVQALLMSTGLGSPVPRLAWGTGEVHTENWFGQGVSMDATLFTTEEMTGYLHEAGFQVEQVRERDPYDFEYQSRRVYILANKG